MAKRKSAIDIRLPLPADISLSGAPSSTILDPNLQKQIIRTAIKAAHQKSNYDVNNESSFGPIRQLVSDEDISMVTALMQALQPTNAVEAALAMQFIATHTQGMSSLQSGNARWALPLLTFSQSTLDNLQRYRNKGMQQINVQYNVNQGQVVNIRNEKVNNEQV